MKKILLLFLLLNSAAQAQQFFPRVIEGRITDAQTGQPVPYASVGILDHPIGTSSNADGTFTLKIPISVTAKDFKIKISSVGYENIELENPMNFLELKMSPSVTVLKETIIFSKNQSPEKIVKKAFAAIKKNYNTKPFVYKNFYRHYCKDDTVYGRLIEAAVEVYKKKGYKLQQPFPGNKDEVRVQQLRRSFDKTKVNQGHLPIAIYSVLGTDMVGFQRKSKTNSFFQPMENISTLKMNLRKTRFELDGITEFDNQQVYKITYEIDPNAPVNLTMSTGLLAWRPIQTGTLYINTKDFAFVKVETSRITPMDTIQTLALYKKYQNKYYLYHAIKDGRNSYVRNEEKFTHWYHIESITTDILLKNFEKFTGKEPDREKLFSIRYDSSFWNTYNILKSTPLENNIVAHLGKDQALNRQYAGYDSAEREKFFSGHEDEEKFNQLLKRNKGRVIYIDFWASWCGPCIKEMPASQALTEKYKGRVDFVYLSIDADIEAWRAAIKKHNIGTQFFGYNFRIGTSSVAANLFDVQSIPRYLLVDKRGNFIDQNAKRPSDPKLEEDIERLLAEKIEN